LLAVSLFGGFASGCPRTEMGFFNRFFGLRWKTRQFVFPAEKANPKSLLKPYLSANNLNERLTQKVLVLSQKWPILAGLSIDAVAQVCLPLADLRFFFSVCGLLAFEDLRISIKKLRCLPPTSFAPSAGN
jgi:hypothetical protein